MGKVLMRKRNCKICKASYSSYTREYRLKDSQRSHRNKNLNCLEEQARLRKLHEDAGNTGDLFFDDDDDLDPEGDGISVAEDLIFENSEGQSQQSDDVDDDDPENAEEEEKKEDSDFEIEDDFEEEKNIDDNDSDADSVDSYDRSRKIENMTYDASEVLELELAEENQRSVEFEFQVAEEKMNPRDKSFWNNPSVDLIGQKIKKVFGIAGEYVGEIISWKNPYFKVRYTDGDVEEYTLKEILSLLVVDDIRYAKEGENIDDLDALVGEGVDEMDHVDGSSSVGSLDDIDSNADSKSTSTRGESISTATVLTREECEINDVLKVQEILLAHFYDQTNSPIRFNKVNDGKDVDKIAALQILQYGEVHHMSRTEGDEYLKSIHKLIETVTKKPFDMVKSYKTLKKGFLHRVDQKVPMSFVEIRLPERFFHDIRIRGNRPLPSLKAAHIPLEVAIGILLLRMSPDDLVHDMKPEYWRGHDNEGEPSVQRIYTDWCSSRYACDAQEFYKSN